MSVFRSRPSTQPAIHCLMAAGWALLICLNAVGQEAESDSVDFNRDVKPILSGRCFMCHGPDEDSREAGLRLDTFDGATEDLGGYAAIKPRDLEASALIARIHSDDEYEVMPPPEQGQPLSERERDILKQWIRSGAKYDQHWSYSPPVRPDVPDVSESPAADWAQTAIDHFVLQRMQEQGLFPSPLADRLILARRVALDLTGLPPTVEQADAFANNPSPDAYEQYVDQLLSSDSYGEHWASMWLDLARYADSAGYAEDLPRSIWAYRDYVIRSYQENKPFDQFTVEQIAGDLLPNPSREALIATAFHRNTLTNSEGGTDDEEFRSAAVVDRTNTTMAVWMGTTMACAQCHTHKYDPITQEEYFQVYAILNNTVDNDQRDERPTLPVYSEQAEQKRTQLAGEMETIDRRLKQREAESAIDRQARLQQELATWEQETRGQRDQTVTGRFVKISLSGTDRVLQLAEVQVFAGDENVALNRPASQSTNYLDAAASRAVDGSTDGKYENGSVAHTNHEPQPWWQVDLQSPVAIDRIVIWNRTDADLFRRLDGFTVQVLDSDHQVVWSKTFEQAQREAQTITCQLVPESIAAILRLPVEQRSQDQQETLLNHFAQHFSSTAQLQQKRVELQREYDAVVPETTVPVMQEREEPRTTRIQIRGAFNDLGQAVQPAVPAAFHKIQTDRPDRLALARWLVDRENPLTARVLVNRYWQRLFGRGLVRTSEDFGAQGDLPTHPQLLDYLAVDLMENGWDQKRLLKQIVMSTTYRQDSRVSETHRQLDPDNRWLSRGPRFRITAEMVRDQALAVSGLLSQKMYGPPVRPPAPELNLRAAFSGAISWNAATDEDRYRRAVYTLWRRSSPYPSMETFDVSNREVCDLRRISTNTPLQALVTLNDEAYVEAAQALARWTLDTGKETRPAARAAFRRVLIREPSDAELNELVALFESSKQHFAQRTEAAQQLAVDPLHPVSDQTDMATLAAWTTVGNVLLNLDEVFMKR